MTPYFSGALTERPPFFFTQSVTERPLLLESLSHIQVTSIFEFPAPLGIRYEHTMTSHVSDSDVGLYYDFDVYTAKLLTILKLDDELKMTIYSFRNLTFKTCTRM